MPNHIPRSKATPFFGGVVSCIHLETPLTRAALIDDFIDERQI